MTRYHIKRNKKRSGGISEVRTNPPESQSAVDLRGKSCTGNIGFALPFVLLCIFLYAVIQILPPSAMDLIDRHTAWTLGLTLNAIGIPASSLNNIASGEGLAFRIIPECTAIFIAGLYFSFVVFYPATFLEKVAGLLLGIPVLYLGNLFRLAATFIVSRYNPKLFDLIHVYMGQVYTMFLVILVCVVWLRWLNRRSPGQFLPFQVAGFLGRFFLISGSLFIVWVKIQHGYIRLIDSLIHFGFYLFDHNVRLAHETAIYYETFSIVCFSALVLSTRSLPPAVKYKGLAAGLANLFFFHLFHRIDNAMMAYFHITSLLSADLTMLEIGQYVLPILFLTVKLICRN